MLRVFLVLLVFLVVLFGGVLIVALLLWWLLSRSSREKEAPAIEIKMPVHAPVTEPPPQQPDVATAAGRSGATAEAPAMVAVEAQAHGEPTGPDDLKQIEGIGPKIASVLQVAGIVTFAQLAATDVGRIEEILEAEDPRLRRLADPGTWPEQASLAAAGDWKGLETLQNQLKGGRRVDVA
jgi:predicted flap endonuclease-1-like 5' DNA nuclease